MDIKKIVDALNKLEPKGLPETNFVDRVKRFNFLQLFAPSGDATTIDDDLINAICGGPLSREFLYQGRCAKGNISSFEAECCNKMTQYWRETPYAEILASSVQDLHKEFFMEPNTESRRPLKPFVRACQIRSKNILLDCSQDFQVTTSLSGMVYSLNMPSMKEYFTDELIEGGIYDKMAVSLGHSDREPLTTPHGAFTLSLILTPPRAILTDPLTVSVHDRKSLANFQAMPLPLRSAKEYVIKIKPLARHSDANLRNMPPDVRNCLFQDENTRLNLFNNYSRHDCTYECVREKIKEQCHCLPWDYPRGSNELDIQPCFGKNFVCPQTVLDSSPENDCDCPLDCSSVKYSAAITTKIWQDDGERCRNITPGDLNDINVLLGSWKSFFHTMNFIRDADDLEFFKLYEAADACYQQSGMRLLISYDDSVAEKITRFGRLSFVGMLSNLGKC